MIDPNNVLVRCPNNHELQAAKTDLNRPLVCPVCSVTFTPAGSVADSSPTTLTYGPLTDTVKYPGYTNWMLAMWLIYGAITAGSSIVSALFFKPAVDPSQVGTVPGMVGLAAVGCFSIIALLAGIVMQLMWVFRVHRDARTGGGYDRISPGLALGLSFIPYFNFLWTAITLKKLAAFADDRASKSGSDAVSPIAGICLLCGMVMLLTSCTTSSIMLSAWFRVASDLQASGGVQSIGGPAMQQKIMQALPSWLPMWDMAEKTVTLICVIVYFKTVRKLEGALYPVLAQFRNRQCYY